MGKMSGQRVKMKRKMSNAAGVIVKRAYTFAADQNLFFHSEAKTLKALYLLAGALNDGVHSLKFESLVNQPNTGVDK